MSVPKIIYYSRAFPWYLQNPRVHVSCVHTRVSKLVNFKVQKVQKPDLFYLMNNFPRSPALMTIFYHQQNSSAIHFIYPFTLAPCVELCLTRHKNSYSRFKHKEMNVMFYCKSNLHFPLTQIFFTGKVESAIIERNGAKARIVVASVPYTPKGSA